MTITKTRVEITPTGAALGAVVTGISQRFGCGSSTPLLYCYFQGATSAPKARYQKGFTQQAPAPNTELIDNDMDEGRKERRRCSQCMVKKNGLISENKTAIKNATNILSSSARKVSKPISTDYIEAVNLVTSEPKTSKNRKIGSDAAFTDSTEQPSSPYTTFFNSE